MSCGLGCDEVSHALPGHLLPMIAAHANPLMQAFGFSPADVISNRHGELTAAQRERLDAKHRDYFRKGNLTILLMWGGFTLLIVGSLVLQGAPPQDMEILPYALLGLTVFFGAAWLIARFHARNLTRQRFTFAEGQARTKTRKYYRYGREIHAYELRIGRHKFNLLSQDELSAFEDGVTYRVYYVPYAPLHIILSAEALALPNV